MRKTSHYLIRTHVVFHKRSPDIHPEEALLLEKEVANRERSVHYHNFLDKKSFADIVYNPVCNYFFLTSIL
jgi:hypothetical protein